MGKASLKWIFLIIGTMIGAGYASGRELWQFFGPESGLAIGLFSILFSICCYTILIISFENKTTHYLPILKILVGKRVAHLYDMMIIIYLFTTTVIMLAGSGVTVEAFHYPYWLGIVLMCIPLVLVFVWGIDGVLSLNSFILPLLIVGLVSVLISFLFKENLTLLTTMDQQKNWMAALPFTALNILPLIAVLGAIGNQMQSKGEALLSSVGSGLILGSISYLYNNSLVQIADDILVYEIPLFAILKYYPYAMFLFMSALLWFAIFTTAVSGTLGLVTRIRDMVRVPLWLLVLGLVLAMIPLTKVGFATLIEYLYPLYGLLNLYIMSTLLLYPIINRYKKEAK
ncbi:hypothetical protein GCM10011351_13160 [Paraliobacillus quinghaiensis]|uniref:Uncharacterized protein n=1 Tax=Paraliobacillus quinghaiensis TaxID=470815 RepID=A0A917TMV7_9BACI|nr:hypothetical protein [Paraliobacillus quinghaiensis]GGM28568.1 hypothetical protein GCM10011351_13160 [Paraliobacillus quinghaiensis]